MGIWERGLWGIVIIGLLGWGKVVQGGLLREQESGDFQWLDPEKRIYVLQHRKYQKAQQVLISVLGVGGLSSPYTNSVGGSGQVAYYFSETWGMEGFYSQLMNWRNSTYDSLQSVTPNVLPTIREVTGNTGFSLQWIPWYAKLNTWGTLFYFDWYFSAGIGQVFSQVDIRTRASDPFQYVSQSLKAAFLKSGQVFYFSSHWVIRWEFSMSFFQAPLRGVSGNDTWFSDTQGALGIGWVP